MTNIYVMLEISAMRAIVFNTNQSSIPEVTILTINVTQIYVSTIYFILKQGYMFRLEVIFRPLQHFRYQMLCPLWGPIVFTFVEHILV